MLQNDNYAEHSDEVFLTQVGVEPAAKQLSEFWPKRGPHWDALATLPDGGVILVEAKAHVDEMLSPPSQASPNSLTKIKKALNQTKRFYQHANRLAFLYFLRELNGVPVETPHQTE